MANAGDTGPLTGSLADYTLGGPLDTLGDSWAPAEINNSDFNVTVEPRVVSSGLSASVFLDSVTVKIYTDDGSGQQVWTGFVLTEELLQP